MGRLDEDVRFERFESKAWPISLPLTKDLDSAPTARILFDYYAMPIDGSSVDACAPPCTAELYVNVAVARDP